MYTNCATAIARSGYDSELALTVVKHKRRLGI